MRARDLCDLLLLSLLWGAAYLFTRAAVPAFGPAPLIALRMGIAAAVLLPLLAWHGQLGGLWVQPRRLLLQATAFTALPFLLLGWSALHLSAGLLAVLNATAPLFSALLAHFVLRQPLDRWRAAGLLVGFVGVALLTGGTAQTRGEDGLLAIAAMVLVSAIWALGSHYTRHRLHELDPMVLSAGSLGLASLCLAPLAVAQWPAEPPGLRPWLETVFLGVASSAFGFVVFFRLIARVGPVKAMSVTYLNPVVALTTGALVLGETLTWPMVGAGALVLVGTALALGGRPGRRH
jgi:drug/metabolite transporter (DMT)-like permease